MNEEKKYLPEKVTTYSQLEEVFREFAIDSEKTRFYIGKDYTDPKAFVIYQDDFGNYVVYKMKADGTRALRYKGPDEEYAVNEYYQKFLEEVRKRPAFAKKLLDNNPRNRANKNKMNEDIKWFMILFIAVFVSSLFTIIGLLPRWATVALFLTINPGIFILVIINKIFKREEFFPPKAFSIIALVSILTLGFASNIAKRIEHRKDGYYITGKHSYYRQGRDMYYFINDNWTYYGTYDDFIDYYDDDYYYYDDYIYNDDYNNFEDSYYYDDWKKEDSWSSSDSSDSGWSSSDSWDSWDSGGTDWDSDW